MIKLSNILNYPQVRKALINESTYDSTLKSLYSRVNIKHFNGYMDENGWERDEVESALEYYLEDEFGLSVDGDGLINFDTLSSGAEKLIGNNFVRLFHFAPSIFKGDIKREGLVPGRVKTNPYGNSYSGIYLTTEVSGPAVRGYIYHIKQKHDSDAIVVTVKMKLNELRPDPDDRGISSGKRQFITSKVPSNRIVEIEPAI
jgi:hypothetical protein